MVMVMVMMTITMTITIVVAAAAAAAPANCSHESHKLHLQWMNSEVGPTSITDQMCCSHANSSHENIFHSSSNNNNIYYQNVGSVWQHKIITYT